MIVSEKIGRKAQRLLEDRRIRISADPEYRDVCTVSGDNGFHRVQAQEDRVWCDCEAWRADRYCSHAIAAMLAWAEMMADGRS